MTRTATQTITTPPTTSTDALSNLLGQARQRHYRLDRSWRTWRSVTIALASLIMILLLDLAWLLAGEWWFARPVELAPATRLTLTLAWIVGSALLLAWVVQSRHLRRRPTAWYARLIENRADLTGNPFSNAVQLAQHPSSDPLAAALAIRARQAADSIARSVKLDPIFQPAAVLTERRRAGMALGILLVILLGWPLIGYPKNPLALPIHALLPGMNVTPPSLTGFEVAWLPDPVVVGDDVPLQVRRLGREAGPVMLSMHESDERILLTPDRIDEGLHGLTLSEVREPIRFRIVSGGSRSRLLTIDPIHLPELAGVELILRGPDGETEQAVRYPRSAPILARTGSTLEIRAAARPGPFAPLQLDHPEADGLSLTLPVTAGEQALRLALLDPETGRRSRETIALTLVGLSQAALREATESASESLQSDSLTTTPENVEIAPTDDPADPDADPTTRLTGDDPLPSDPNDATEAPKTEPEQNGSAESESVGRGGEVDPDREDDPLTAELRPGLRLAKPRPQSIPSETIRAAVEVAPPAYRERVIQYFQALNQLDPTEDQP